MELKPAFDNIVNVVRAYRGNADEHDALRESLEAIGKVLKEACPDAFKAPAKPVEAASEQPAPSTVQ